MPRPAVLTVLNLVIDATGATVPSGLPPEADVIKEGDSGWLTIYPAGREVNPDRFAHARLLGDNGTLGLWFIISDFAALINAAEALGGTRAWRTWQALRDDTSPAATAVKALLRDERPVDSAGNPIGVREALYHGVAGFAEDNGEG